MDTWFKEYLPQLENLGFKLDRANTSSDGHLTSFIGAANPKKVKEYFKSKGFSNLDGRTYMAHTGNPHINYLDKDENTVQVSWYPKGGPVGISFLNSLRSRIEGE